MSNDYFPVFNSWSWNTWSHWEVIQMGWRKLPLTNAYVNQMNLNDLGRVQWSCPNVVSLKIAFPSIKVIDRLAWHAKIHRELKIVRCVYSNFVLFDEAGDRLIISHLAINWVVVVGNAGWSWSVSWIGVVRTFIKEALYRRTYISRCPSCPFSVNWWVGTLHDIVICWVVKPLEEVSRLNDVLLHRRSSSSCNRKWITKFKSCRISDVAPDSWLGAVRITAVVVSPICSKGCWSQIFSNLRWVVLVPTLAMFAWLGLRLTSTVVRAITTLGLSASVSGKWRALTVFWVEKARCRRM